jgi:pterin-4a-carbinolamine dehydratase
MSEETSPQLPENEVPPSTPEKSHIQETDTDGAAMDTPAETEAPTTEEKGKTEKVEDGTSAPVEGKEGDIHTEIDESNAEDAEDKDTDKRHQIPMPDYHSMTMENLVGELQRLIKNEKVQAIKKHVDGIKEEFNLKFQDFIEQKKEDFIGNGGNEIDFKYNSVTKRQFNEVYNDYREKRNQYYKNLEKGHKENLAHRLDLIEQLKGLVSMEEDINTTYNNFKKIQEEWKNAGPVPRAEYNNVWRTYHHHIEIFYDFLHLNRELRDLDFKHNLEEKEKVVQQAEALAHEPDLNKAFRQLQLLHKIWKEDIGPVGKEHREEIWERFSTATKAIHERRQEYFKQLDAVHEENLVRKNEIIFLIQQLSDSVSNNHRELQKQIKQLDVLRDAFFKAGKVPQHQNEKTWKAFKEAVRSFNRHKNTFYKNLKKEQQDNMAKKKALIAVAESLKDSEDWDTATAEMKRIQNEWKGIGHVPRKYSDKLWKSFKGACNHYFDRFHASKNSAYKEEEENLKKKEECLDRLKSLVLSGDKDQDVARIKELITEWKSYGNVPFKKKSINQKFNTVADAIFAKLNIGQKEAELLKYGNKIQQLAKDDNQERAILQERSFIRKKIEESKDEIRQLENNLQFFSDASESNPLVQDVIKRVEKHKEALSAWKAKLKKLNILQNNLNKESQEDAALENTEEDTTPTEND